ncbi:hypothetical protein AMTR_s00083p00144810 [Amborella trichopoda]|uniref:Uncharacterized protein n=1 Tax=Amborella trichopoda TaxID=13333 RepID=W1P6C8_AMBTC|nr:hypothetical protein AMTR_s00083p00144810 [Amborella trichopoda]
MLIVASEGEDVQLIELTPSILLLHEQGNMDQHSTLPLEMLNQTDGEVNINRKAINSIVLETAIVESAKVDLNDGVSLEGEAHLARRPISIVLELENLVQDGPLMADALMVTDDVTEKLEVVGSDNDLFCEGRQEELKEDGVSLYHQEESPTVVLEMG